MKICVAQTKPVKGDISKNTKNHKKLIDLAIQNQADIIVFPELSLTGYEPELASQLAMNPGDKNLDTFENLSTTYDITIGIGLPIKIEDKVGIGMVIFQPDASRKTYIKHYLHPGEESHFVSGINLPPITFGTDKIALAICYETSIAEHAKKAFEDGATIYIASVLNSVNGIDKDLQRIEDTAKQYSAIALMANLVGKSGSYDCAGKSTVWDTTGTIVGQLDDINEGILIIDTKTLETKPIQ